MCAGRLRRVYGGGGRACCYLYVHIHVPPPHHESGSRARPPLSNSKGKAIANKQYVNTRTPKPIQTALDIHTEAETFYIRKGANGTLPCLPLTTGDSQAAMNRIEWYKEDKKLVEVDRKNVVVWETKGSVAYLPESGALLFRGVSNEDSGEYRCRLIRHNPVLPLEDSIEDGVVRFYVQGKCFLIIASLLDAG